MSKQQLDHYRRAFRELVIRKLDELAIDARENPTRSYERERDRLFQWLEAFQ